MAVPSYYKQIALNSPMAPSGPSGPTKRGHGGSSSSERARDAMPIFTHSNYSNPAFTPQKLGKASTKIVNVPKAPKPPEKPILPYMRYSKKVWDTVKSSNPDIKLWEVAKKIETMWKNLGEAEKQKYIDAYEAEKTEYEKNLKAYHISPAYLTFLAKTKPKSSANTDDTHETPSRSSGKGQQDRRIDIQPAEDEDDYDDGYSFKHLAYARFIRNHRLINEIFSDVVLPDVRSVVTTHRMEVLKKQVDSLTMHQTKLEAELRQMEDKFESKKRKMIESSELFQQELKKHCKPAVDEDQFQKMVQKMYESARKERQKYIEASSQIISKPINGDLLTSKLENVPMEEEAANPVNEEIKTKENNVENAEKELNADGQNEQSDSNPVPVSQQPNEDTIQKPSTPISQQNQNNSGQLKTYQPNKEIATSQPLTEQAFQSSHPVAPHHNPNQLASPYGGYAPSAGHPRPPYYPTQYGGHPAQAYGQYNPYPYQQQYGHPPSSPYMNSRPPQGHPMHYQEHPFSQPTHDVRSAGNTPPTFQQNPTQTMPTDGSGSEVDGTKREIEGAADPKDSE